MIAKAEKGDLHGAGFVMNDDKSVWDACQQLDWLGIWWDSARKLWKLFIEGLPK